MRLDSVDSRTVSVVALDISSLDTRSRLAFRSYVGVDVRWRLLAADHLAAAAAAATVCRRQTPPHAGDVYVIRVTFIVQWFIVTRMILCCVSCAPSWMVKQP